MNALQEFKFNGTGVRVIVREGILYWVMKDVCDILGLTNITETTKRLDPDEFSHAEVTDSMNRDQLTRVVNESGLYSIIMRSDKPEAKAFRKWVTSEVLPQIRKTGSYSLEAKLIYPTDPHDQVIALCDRLKAMTIEAKQLTQKIAEQAPKVALAEACIVSDSLQSLTEVSKVLKVHPRLFTNYLRDIGVLYKKGDIKPTDGYIDDGYFECKEFIGTKKDGTPFNRLQTYVTGKGIFLLQEIADGLEPDSRIRNKINRKAA